MAQFRRLTDLLQTQGQQCRGERKAGDDFWKNKILFLRFLFPSQPEPNAETLGTSPPTTITMAAGGAGGGIVPVTTATSLAAASLGPNEIIRNSGKFSKPTKIPGKNYSKDEIVIRNADSGKGEAGGDYIVMLIF